MFEKYKKKKLEKKIKKNEDKIVKLKEEMIEMGKLMIKDGKLVREEEARQPIPMQSQPEQDEMEEYFPPHQTAPEAYRQPMPQQRTNPAYDYEMPQQMPPQQPLPPREYVPQPQVQEPQAASGMVIVKFNNGESFQLATESHKIDTILNNLAEACDNQVTVQLGRIFVNGRNILFFTYQ